MKIQRRVWNVDRHSAVMPQRNNILYIFRRAFEILIRYHLLLCSWHVRCITTRDAWYTGQWYSLKITILSFISHLHVVPNPWDLCSSSEYKLRYFLWNPRAFWPCIDSNGSTTFKAQEHSRDIVKTVIDIYIYIYIYSYFLTGLYFKCVCNKRQTLAALIHLWGKMIYKL